MFISHKQVEYQPGIASISKIVVTEKFLQIIQSIPFETSVGILH
jgi:hypothetical protein